VTVSCDKTPAVQVREVSFRYASSEPDVLHDFSVEVSPGECIAIVGPSGAGKTTLLKLMTGLLAPQSGRVMVDGVDLERIGQRQYRRLFGAVMQDDTLLKGTITENISFFDLETDHAWVEECARIASIHNEIVAMPMGYNTRVGDLGSTLSGGQRQRIFLARALYKRPKLLFLDEATSHLDLANEQAINLALKSLSVSRIMIAHRPDTIAMADRIVTVQGPGVFRDPQRVTVKA